MAEAPRHLTDDELRAWIVEAAHELAEVAAITGAREEVPACPGWTMRQLVAHVYSGLAGWYTYNLRHGAAPLDYRASWTSQPDLPRGNAERLGVLTAAADEFSALVETLDLDAPCHVFHRVRTAREWLRRAATETAIHLRDAQHVLGEIADWSPDRAYTSIDETLGVMWHGALLLKGDPDGTRVPDEPVMITATDLGVSWRVHAGPDDFVVAAADVHELSADHTVSGPSSALIPWFWNRSGADRLDLVGDRAVIEAWNLSANI